MRRIVRSASCRLLVALRTRHWIVDQVSAMSASCRTLIAAPSDIIAARSMFTAEVAARELPVMSSIDRLTVRAPVTAPVGSMRMPITASAMRDTSTYGSVSGLEQQERGNADLFEPMGSDWTRCCGDRWRDQLLRPRSHGC